MKDRSHDIKFVEITDSYEDLCKQANKVVEEAEELLGCLIGKHVSFTKCAVKPRALALGI